MFLDKKKDYVHYGIFYLRTTSEVYTHIKKRELDIIHTRNIKIE